MNKTFSLLLFFCFLTIQLHGQTGRLQFFKEVSLAIDTALFTLSEHQYNKRGEPHLWFVYQEENPVVELRFYPITYPEIDSIVLLPSGDFKLVDSLRLINNNYYRTKVKFKKLTNTSFLTLTLKVSSRYLRDTHYLYELRLFPTTITKTSLLVENDELFIGEEKTFQVETNNLDNIKVTNVWTTMDDLSYRFSKRKGKLFLHLLPQRLGIGLLETTLNVKKPYMNEFGEPEYTLPPIARTFIIKPAKLVFLNINRGEVSLTTENRRKGIEIELDYTQDMQMQKTYRVEAREEPGGALIAEIFTRQILANEKALCWLRLYDYHRRQDGYLYIKDGDEALYITNLDIVPEMNIEQISIRKEGQDWKAGNTVYPGEKVDIRLEGESLHRAEFRFDGLVNVKQDSLLQTEKMVAFSGEVPVQIDKKRIQIFNRGSQTNYALKVKEYIRPRPFDFVYLNYNDQRTSVAESNQLIFIEETLKDILIEFDPEQIDQERLYGEQHLELDLEVRDKSNNLLDQRTISKILVSPGISSPRFNFYNQTKAQKTSISLNNYFRKKTFDQDIWTRIKISFKHREDKYQEDIVEKTIEFVLFRAVTFNIDVSFPAGLLVKRFDEPGFGNLGGISMAMMAQFSFYKDNSIARSKPYKFGLGFLAFNAFNFDEGNNNRDVGLVALASIYPIKTKDSSRLSFPLFTGAGYFLSDSKWFLLLGPGIRVRL